MVQIRVPFVLLLALFFLTGFQSFAQKELIKKADELMAEKKYKEAISLYKQVYDKEKKKDKGLVLKLADANFENENYRPAQKYYAEYFSDSLFQDIPQFGNYAKTARINGNLKLASRLYYKIYENKQDPAAKTNYEIYKLYMDTIQKIRVYNLDSNYSCVSLDAAESIDALAPPMSYLWTLEDSSTVEGTKFDHCFDKGGLHKVMLSVRDQQTGLLHFNDTTFTIYIEDSPVKFTSPKSGKQYLPVQFDASATSFYFSDILDYLWDMDNGQVSTGKKMEYTYYEFGTYNVRLTVITQDKTTGKRELFSAIKRIVIDENYIPNGKSFIDQRNEAK